MILEQDVPFTASDINSEDAEYLIGNAIAGFEPAGHRDDHGVEGCFGNGYLRGEGGQRGDRDHDEERAWWVVR